MKRKIQKQFNRITALVLSASLMFCGNGSFVVLATEMNDPISTVIEDGDLSAMPEMPSEAEVVSSVMSETIPEGEMLPSAMPEITPEVEVTPSVTPETTPEVEVTPSVTPETTPEAEVSPSATLETTPEAEMILSVTPEITPEAEVTPSVQPEMPLEVEVIPSVTPETTPEVEVLPSVMPETTPEVEVIPSVTPEITSGMEMLPTVTPEEEWAEETELVEAVSESEMSTALNLAEGQETALAEVNTEGRDYAGQVNVSVGGVDYVLIGDKQQMFALDKGETDNADAYKVTGPIWRVERKDTDKAFETAPYVPVSATLVYPGDADLISEIITYNYTYDEDGNVTSKELVTKDFSNMELYGIDDSLPLPENEVLYEYGLPGEEKRVKLGKVYCYKPSVTYANDADTVIYVKGTLESPEFPEDMGEGLPDKVGTYELGGYTVTSNYIIFRDISLDNAEWKPLTYSGKMYGVKSTNGSKLWDESKTMLQLNVSNPAIISDFKVTPILKDNKLDVTRNVGVGFFSTISGKYDDSAVAIEGSCVVQNITLKNGTVENTTTSAEIDETLVNGLTKTLGTLVGGLLDVILTLLTFGQVKWELSDVLSNLLDARKEDPDSLATGGFAGKIVGGAVVLDCTVEQIEVIAKCTDFEKENTGIFDNNVGKIVGTGGFVGNVEGEARYDFISGALEGLVELLTGILNIIPGLGLGDLITLLLGNVLTLEKLVPTGYTQPKIENCTVREGTLTLEEGKYAVGGFAGSIGGLALVNCNVIDSNMDIKAQKYAGGIVGILRDGEIKSTLSGLGIELLSAMQPQGELINCNIKNSTITVNGGSHLGGLAGIVANSYIFNCGTDTVTSITLNGDTFIGGVAGNATVGTHISIDEIAQDEDLLSTLIGAVTNLLGTGEGDALLALGGVSSSAIMGCQMNGTLQVTALGNYAGGIVGNGEGILITSSAENNIRKLTKYKLQKTVDGKEEYIRALPITVEEARRNEISNLVSVSANQYAGGISGFLTTASVAGLLDGTVGAGNYLEFTVSETDVNGIDTGFTVQTTYDYAGGGVGIAVGGTFSDVKITNLKSVTANNKAAGFVSYTGPGSLANTGGINLSLLGLDILKLSGLLSLVDGIRTFYSDVDVCGIGDVDNDGKIDGFTVSVTGTNSGTSITEYSAGGFVAQASSIEMKNCNVKNLKSVTANLMDGKVGGFVGVSIAGGIAEVADDGTVGGNLKDSDGKSLIQIGDLVDAVPYLIPYYDNCHVYYVADGYVEANCAGGFTGEFQSGKVNSKVNLAEVDAWAVHGIDHVTGVEYAGGFGGNVYSGALVSAGGGVSLLGILNLNIVANDLLDLVNAYIPIINKAGVESSENGLVVSAIPKGDNTSQNGKAGGYIGYGSGVQISDCDVNKLRRTDVTAPKDLESIEAPTYFSENSAYAVTATSVAGGYIGHMDVGSAASVGGGLELLGENLQLGDVLNVANAVVSTIEHSDVTGAAGGSAVLASGTDSNGDPIGKAGGFVGLLDGGHIQNSSSYNFSYIIGQIAAGGYVGEMKPGNVANVMGDDASILKKLVNIDANFLSVAEDFVPTIRNSETTCVPCGGVVRAQAFSDISVRRGMAGGYCGHNEGGNIWGNNSSVWKTENVYSGLKKPCQAVRILSVYGAEYAGGFTGYMEGADTASGGNLSLLFGLIEVNNLLGALEAVYPTEENTAVYGPLYELDVNTWNAWVDAIGKNGSYGRLLAATGKVSTQEEFEKKLIEYTYGYHVVAGRNTYQSNTIVADGGCAGGYVGLMKSGTITNGQAVGAKKVTAMKSAGGFVGEMKTGGAADLGTVSILGLDLNLGKTVSVLDAFVPVVKVSSVEGYEAGLSVLATGIKNENNSSVGGYAGGYVGYASGAQIWGDATETQNDNDGCNVTKLREVSGINAVGGYVGWSTAGTVADADTSETSSGVIQSLLNTLISSQGSLLSALEATQTTIRQANVSSADEDWGFVVDGEPNNDNVYAPYAGGFAGHMEATVVGQLLADGSAVDMNVSQSVNGLRGVIGGYYAGGFFGLAETGQVAEVGGSSAEGDDTSILAGLLNVGDVTALDAFRSYVYNSDVNGVSDGFTVRAYNSANYGTHSETRYNGDAGGFGGSLQDGSVKECNVTNLAVAEGPNNVGGFIGHMDKGGVADVGQVNALGSLLDLGANVLNVFGSHAENCTLAGIPEGFIVKAWKEDEQAVAGGFVGYADLSRILDCSSTNQKAIISTQIAGGFVGRTNMSYLVNAEANSELVNFVLKIVNGLLKLLQIDDLEEGDKGIDIGIPFLVYIELFQKGQAIQIRLLELLIISVSLAQNDTVAEIRIGDSIIQLNVTKNADGDFVVDESDLSNLKLNLIKGNRTEIERCTVAGIARGYDVFGGGANQFQDGTHINGYAGGFIGYNDEGKLEDNTMLYCDVVRGTPNIVGPFTGVSSLDTVYEHLGNTLDNLETGNKYTIYRSANSNLTKVVTAATIGSTQINTNDNVTNGTYNEYVVLHRSVIKQFSDLEGAKEVASQISTVAGGGDTAQNSEITERELLAYESPAKAVLMLDLENSVNYESLTPKPAERLYACEPEIALTLTKVWDDNGNDNGIRPNSVTMRVNRSYTDVDGVVHTELVADVVLTAEDASKWSTGTWQRVVEYRNEDSSNSENRLTAMVDSSSDTPLYYSYTVEEISVNKYISKMEVDDAGYVFTVTNSQAAEFPATGAQGSFGIVLVGAAMICFASILRKKKTPRKEVNR